MSLNRKSVASRLAPRAPVARLILSTAVMLTAAALAPNSASAANVGQFACYKLEQNCLAHAAKVRAFTAKANGSASFADTSDTACYDANAKATQTGVWPAHDAMPEVACSN